MDVEQLRAIEGIWSEGQTDDSQRVEEALEQSPIGVAPHQPSFEDPMGR